MLLPDVNVWIALAFDTHIHHPVAKAWFDNIGSQECVFCRLTQQGFLRLATNPKALAEDAVSLDQAWSLYDAILADQRIQFSAEPAGLEAAWRAYTRGSTFSTKVWSDAYLAAFAVTCDQQLITIDKGFGRYDKLNWSLLQ